MKNKEKTVQPIAKHNPDFKGPWKFKLGEPQITNKPWIENLMKNLEKGD